MVKPCATENFLSFHETVPTLLKAIGAPQILARQSRILIKPNLVNHLPPPVTLPVEACAALVSACRSWSKAEILIAEGTGDRHRTTAEVFRIHGYDQLAGMDGVKLVDLNQAELVELRDPCCRVFPTFMMPRLVMESFVLSAAVLKAHTLARVTLSMKNMVGVAPPAFYQKDGHWKKSAFHRRMHASVFELNRYRKPDLAFIDASVGLAKHHLRGPICDPPVNKLVAGFDPVAVDAAGAALLGIRWKRVRHIRIANGELGFAHPEEGFFWPVVLGAG